MIAESGDRLRKLTPVECERLQGFPDGWTERDAEGRPVSNTARYTCIGNAVMVPVAQFLGKRLMAVSYTHLTLPTTPYV